MPAYGNPLLQQPQRTMGAPRNVAYMPGTGPSTGRTAQRLAGSFGGLNEFYALQDRSRPAFADPRGIYGLGPSAQEEGRRSTQAGLIYNPYMGGYLPDTMYSRTMGSRGAGTVPNVQPQPPQMTDQQMEWAQKAQAGKSGSDVLGKMGEKMAGFTGSGSMLGSAARTAFAAGNAAMNAASGSPTFASSQNPYFSGTRAQNIENAKAAGEFENVQDAFNDRNLMRTGYVMDDNGIIQPYKPEYNFEGRQKIIDDNPYLWDRAVRSGKTARGDEASATSPRMEQLKGYDVPEIIEGARQVSGKAFIENPYGKASATYGEPRKGPGMVKDELTGKMVPISQAVADMKAVQATKGINPETGAPLDEKETKKAQEGFLASRGKRR